MHLVGFIIRIYHDARSPERQIHHLKSTFFYLYRKKSVIVTRKLLLLLSSSSSSLLQSVGVNSAGNVLSRTYVMQIPGASDTKTHCVTWQT